MKSYCITLGILVSLSFSSIAQPDSASTVTDTIAEKKISSAFRIISFKSMEQGGYIKFNVQVDNAELLSKLILEQSSDGKSFNKLNTLLTTNSKAYVFSEEPEADQNYYRVTGISFSGEKLLSPVIKLAGISNHAASINIFPNPVHNRLNFSISGVDKEIVTATVINLNGKEEMSLRIILNSLSSEYALPAAGLKKGSYQLQIRGKNFKITKPFTKL